MNTLGRHWLIYLITALSALIVVFVLSFFSDRTMKSYQSQRLVPLAIEMTAGEIRSQRVVSDTPSVRYLLVIEGVGARSYVLSLEEHRSSRAQRWLAQYDEQGQLEALKEQRREAPVVIYHTELQALVGDQNTFISYDQQRLQNMLQDAGQFVLSEVKRAPYF